jgi:hypothetical protein
MITEPPAAEGAGATPHQQIEDGPKMAARRVHTKPA